MVDRTVSEIESTCGTNINCLRKLHGQNDRLMPRIAEDTEEELRNLGVPGHAFRNVILMPFCRLGSQYAGEERELLVPPRFGPHNIMRHIWVTPWLDLITR